MSNLWGQFILYIEINLVVMDLSERKDAQDEAVDAVFK